MKSFNKRRISLAVTAALGATIATGAVAQDAPEGEGLVEEVLVTGSRLTKSNIESSVPLVQVGSEEINARGVTRVEDIVNILPNVFVAQTAEVANGATGTSTLNLRGLGANRTLVLIDGKRLPFGSPFSSAANVDMVPAQLVERVDVVTSGASATYGSDAVAGVVNFITKRDYEGFQIDYQAGINNNPNDDGFYSDVLERSGLSDQDPGSVNAGEEYQLAVTWGVNSSDGKGNMTVFANYVRQEELLGADRDTGACTLGGTSTIRCIGSSNFRRFNTSSGFRANNPGSPSALFQDDDGTLIPLDTSQARQTYNFGARNHYQRPVERWNINASGYYKITDEVEAYVDVSFLNNNTTAQIAESASFNRPFQTNCDNPLLQLGRGPNGTGDFSFADFVGIGSGDAYQSCNDLLNDGDPLNDSTEVAFINSHRNVEGGPRQSTFDNSTWRTVAGFRGDINENFSFDIFAQYAATRGQRISQNDLNFNRVQQALFVVDDGNGNAVCRDTSGGCVPWNIFTRNADGSTAIDRAQTDFIQGTGIVTGQTEQTVFGGTIEGDLTGYGVKLPWADNGLTGLVGFEVREDILSRITDDISQVSGGRGLTGTGGATLPIQGKIEVTEFFAEAELPLIQGAPLAQELGLKAGYRYSDYTTGSDSTADNSFTADTWFVGSSWTPVDDIRFRANFSRSIRAPNVFDLFLDINTGLTDLTTGENGLFDPCAADPINGITPSASLEACARTGVTAEQYNQGIEDNPAGQYNLITGGNPGLGPETSDTTTFGVVITPSAVEGLSIAIDYFDIEVTEAIGSVPAQASLDNCIAGGAGSDTFCALIQRDIFGTLWLSNDAPGGGLAGISQQNANIAALNTSGVDLNIKYDLEVGDYGMVNFDYAATFLDELSTTPFAGSAPIDCVDQYAGQCGLPSPEYNHRFLAVWTTPWDLTVSATWRHVGETQLFGLDTAAAAQREEQMNDYMEARNYFDLAFNYDLNENVDLRLGVNNLFAVQPPTSTNVGTGTGNNNTYPGLFDVNRFIFVGAKLNF